MQLDKLTFDILLDNLSLSELTELRDVITCRIRKNDVTLKVNKAIQLVKSNFGFNEFNFETRKWNHVRARIILTALLNELGYTKNAIGIVIHKDHATVIYYLKQLQEWMKQPKVYSKELEVYNRIKKQIQ